MPKIHSRDPGNQCYGACSASSQSHNPSKHMSDDAQNGSPVARPNPQRQAQARSLVQYINKDEHGFDALLPTLNALQRVNTAARQRIDTGEKERNDQCCPSTDYEKSTFIMDQNTPRSAELQLNSIKAAIERLTQKSSDTSELVRQKRKELLELIADKLGIPDADNLLSHIGDQITDNAEFLMTFDSIVKDPKNAEALGIQEAFSFNTANTGAEALADPKIKADFEILLDKLDRIPVHGIKQHAANAVENLPETKNYGNLKAFLTHYTLPPDDLLKKGSTLLGSLNFKSSKREYTCLIMMNSSKKRLGSQTLPDQPATANPAPYPPYPNSKSYMAYLNFTSSLTGEKQVRDEKLIYKAGVQTITFDPPKKTKVTKEMFLDWILGASSQNENDKSNTPHLIHICAADLIPFGMVETDDKKNPTRVVPRTGTSVQRKKNQPIVASSDKENVAPGSSNTQNVNNADTAINHRVYDTEHMMLTLAHELSKHIANKDQADNKMKISLLSSYKACISCTRAITTLPFNEKFKNLLRFFYLETKAHDYRIDFQTSKK